MNILFMLLQEPLIYITVSFASNSAAEKKKIRTFVYRAVEKEKCKTSELLCLL